jgi:pimeloyl-ACP methyl ester carboxylesterase
MCEEDRMADALVGGLRLSYDVVGDGAPVLLVCGTGASAAMWQFVLGPALHEAGYSTIEFDNRGVAPSDIPAPPYTVEEMAADSVGLLDHLGIDRCAVVGASLGALITQMISREHSERVAAAVLMAGGGPFTTAGRTTIRAFAELVAAGPVPPATLEALMLPSLVPSPAWHDDAAVEAGLMMAGAFQPPDLRGLLGQYQACLAWNDHDRTSELAALTVPVLALPAEHDLFFSPKTIHDAVLRTPTGEVVQITGAPHVAMAPEYQAIVNSEVVSFLQRHHPA